MRAKTTYTSLFLFLLLAVAGFLMKGCGQPIAKDQGCPSGTYLANSTDTLTGTASTAFTGPSPSYGNAFLGGTVLFTPVTFIVSDASGPRNNICLFAYTADTATGPGPYWYTDMLYSTLIYGTGPYNARVLVTNDAGVATAYWSTAWLPAANPALITGGTSTAPTWSPGDDQSGTSYIKVYSGTKEYTFNVNWTVKGEPAP